MKVHKGDTVLVIAGKDKGAKGKVLQAYPDRNRAPGCFKGAYGEITRYRGVAGKGQNDQQIPRARLYR